MSLLLAQTMHTKPPVDEMLAWWNAFEFDGTYRNMTSSHSGLVPLQIEGYPTGSVTGLATGKIGFCAELQAASTPQKSLRTSYGLPLNADWAISMWFKPGYSTTSTGLSSSLVNAVSGTAWTISYTDNFLSTSIGNISLPLASKVNWHHLAINYNKATNTMSIYLDNVLGASGTLNLTSVSVLDFISTRIYNSSFTQSLDESAFYTRLLTVGEISGLYNSGAGVGYSSRPTKP